jgi:hypothetical protein
MKITIKPAIISKIKGPQRHSNSRKHRFSIAISTNQTPKNWTALGPKFGIGLNNLFNALIQMSSASDDEQGLKTYSDFADTFSDPTTFHRVFMDIFSVVTLPKESRGLFLNSNPEMILDKIPKGPFRLGYATASGGSKNKVGDIFEQQIMPRYVESGLKLSTAQAIFLVIISDPRHSDPHDLIPEAANTIPIGIDMDDLKQILGQDFEQNNLISTGFISDPDMGDRVRLSVLSFHTEEK